jgi:hypothetical protein
MVLVTCGLWLLVIPFYPARCVTCGLTRHSALIQSVLAWYRGLSRTSQSVVSVVLFVVLFVVLAYFSFFNEHQNAPQPTSTENATSTITTEPKAEDLPPVKITIGQLLLAFHNDFEAAQKQYPKGQQITITGPVFQSHYPSLEAVQKAEIRVAEGHWSPWDGPALPNAQLWLGPTGEVSPDLFTPGGPISENGTMDSVDQMSPPGVMAEARQGYDKEDQTPTWFGQPIPLFSEPFGTQLTLSCRMYGATHLPPKKTIVFFWRVRTVQRLVDVSIALDDCVLVKRGSDENESPSGENESSLDKPSAGVPQSETPCPSGYNRVFTSSGSYCDPESAPHSDTT